VTVAICIKCGTRKHGALTPCPECQFDPEENEDKAKSMILTDHFLSLDDLDGIGQRIRTGQAVKYPEEALADYVRMFEQGSDRAPKAVFFGCIVAGLALLCLGVYLLVRLIEKIL